jgi:hypothetical protein
VFFQIDALSAGTVQAIVEFWHSNDAYQSTDADYNNTVLGNQTVMDLGKPECASESDFERASDYVGGCKPWVDILHVAL